MSDIKLFSLKNGLASELAIKSLDLERTLQNVIEKNMETFFGVTFLESEYGTGKFIAQLDSNTSDLYQNIKTFILSLGDDVQEKTLKYYQAFKRIKNFICLKQTEARKLLDLNQKIEAQKEIKNLEKKRNEKRRHLFEAQDNVDARKEELIGNVEQRLKQMVNEELLFSVKWRLV